MGGAVLCGGSGSDPWATVGITVWTQTDDSLRGRVDEQVATLR